MLILEEEVVVGWYEYSWLYFMELAVFALCENVQSASELWKNDIIIY